jgi:hypothetical protein
MTVEVSDADFKMLPEYSGDQRGKVDQEKGLDCPVTWGAGNLSALGGKTVRFRIHLNGEAGASPRLYAVNLRTE